MGCGNRSQQRTGAGCATVNEVVIKRGRTGLLDDEPMHVNVRVICTRTHCN